MTTLGKIKNDPRVSQVWDEGEDGWWALLKEGYSCPESEAHACHELSLKKLYETLKTVKECACQDCKKTKTKNSLRALVGKKVQLIWGGEVREELTLGKERQATNGISYYCLYDGDEMACWHLASNEVAKVEGNSITLAL